MHFRNSNFKRKMNKLKIPQKLVYEKFYTHESFTYMKLPPQIYQKFTSWKKQRKHVIQTTAI